jgi:hypothetical protein
MSEQRITEADLARWDSRPGKAGPQIPVILLVAEVRRLRGLIAAFPGSVAVDDLLDEAEAIRAESKGEPHA